MRLPAPPGYATSRTVARVTRRTVTAAVGTGTRVSVTIVRAIVAGESASELAEELAAETSDRLRHAFSPGSNGATGEIAGTTGAAAATAPGAWRQQPTALPELFAALLDRSADIHQDQGGHPAYLRLMAELAPDEARILRLFARQGPQPALDVRTKRPFGVGSKLIAPGITMIGLNAGCAEPERVPSYLNNLFRLGFVWFSRESVADIDGYQVLEAQPEVVDAAHSVKRATTILRSIELTAFGKNFCSLCGLMDDSAATARATLSETTRQLPPPDGR